MVKMSCENCIYRNASDLCKVTISEDGCHNHTFDISMLSELTRDIDLRQD